MPGVYSKFPAGVQMIMGNGLALGNRDQIVAVFVAGRLRLWRGWPVDWDGRALMHEIAKRARDAVGRAPIQRIHPVSSKHRAATLGEKRHVP